MGSALDVLANYNPTGFAQGNQLRQGQIQQQAQQTQALQLENVLKQRQLKDADALTKAWTDVDTSAPLAEQQRQLTGSVIRNGGSGQAVLGVGAHFAQMRSAYATATKDELANAATIHDADAGAVMGIVSGPAEDKQASWTDQLPTLRAHYPNENLPDQYPGDGPVTAFGNRIRSLSSQVKTLQGQTEAKKNEAQTVEALAKADADRQRIAIQADLEARQKAARDNPNDPALQAAALDAKERADLQMKQIDYSLQRDKLNNQLRHQLVEEASTQTRNNIAAGRLAETKRINNIEYGPGQIDYWVQTLQENPDAEKLIPAKIRGTVGQGFKAATGLPLPVALEGQAKQNETNAGTSLENIQRIRQLVADPEIQSRLGPILGRLGNVEQRVGAAAGLSPQAEEKAQELRTLMRYFVFQEGKTILGGRLPRQLMQELQSSSANTHMDAPTLAGALNGAEAQAGTVRDNAERARFGGQMRPAAMRQGPAVPIRVREKASGQTGTIPANEFDPAKYDRL